ncbi:hypothetical protein GCM10022393_09630 [Aquimarina addita]|uniref:Uncharacterized protein n=1 Tax=Aquimarina addita TaxID=870485 RepID=A0ABP7XF43_9FLAO
MRVLKSIEVYANHEVSAKNINTLLPDQLIQYNREKRRNGEDWMEIFLENNKKAYIKKDTSAFSVCDKVILDDDSALGFGYSQKTEPQLSIDKLFFPQGYLTSSDHEIGTVEMKTVENFEEKKMISIHLEYLEEVVDVKRIFFVKEEEFYIINRFSPFIEVDNLKGKKGLLLDKTNSSSAYDKFIQNVAIIIAIVTVLAIFLGFLANGWIVISKLMVIAGFVVAIVAIFILQAILMAFKEIFEQIRKRF